MSSLAPAVVLDRDGTLIEEAGYLDSLDGVADRPTGVQAARRAAQAGDR